MSRTRWRDAALDLLVIAAIVRAPLPIGAAATGAAPVSQAPESRRPAVLLRLSGDTTAGSPTLDPAASHALARLLSGGLALSVAPLDPGRSSSLAGILRVELRPGEDAGAVAASLEANSGVEWAEPDHVAHAAATPNDPLLSSQSALTLIDTAAAWDTATGSPSVVVAVLDTGVDATHPDLAAKLWSNPGETPANGLDDDDNGYVDDVHGWNFIAGSSEVADDDGHGTRVAGIAAAGTDNGTGIAGICWGCRIMPVKVMQAGGVANYSDVARGIAYAAAKGARVIVISLGGYADSRTLRTAVEAAADSAVIVAAAGDDNSVEPFYPAAYPGVVAVGGTTDADARAAFSNYGDWVDLAAPAENVTTTLTGGAYGAASGTSFAAPLVAGVVGLIWSQHPDWSPELVRAQVIHTTDAIAEPLLGSGRLSAASALAQAPHPLITVVGTSVNGDPLGRPVPGETATLAVTLANDWLAAEAVTATLSASDPGVTIVVGSAGFGDIAPGSTATGSTSYSFSVDVGVGYDYNVAFTLDVSANAGAYSVSLPFVLTTRSADQPVSGTLTADTTWTRDNTYVVTGNVGIAPGVTLTIQPGTVVRFDAGYNLSVGGTLLADGNEVQPIRFMANGADPWGRIYFDDQSVDATADPGGTYLGGSIVRWARVEGAAQGVGCNGATPYLSSLTITGGGLSGALGATVLWLQDSDITGDVSLTGSGQLWRNHVSGSLSLDGQSTLDTNEVTREVTLGAVSTVQGNTLGGSLTAPGASVITHNTLSEGAISAGDSATVEDNRVTGGGITASASSSVRNNVVRGGGISASGVVQGNDVEDAPSWGIAASGTVTANRVVACGSGLSLESGTAEGNLVANSEGVGLQVSGGEARYNTITGNGGDAVVIAAGAPTVEYNNLEGNHGALDLLNNSASAIAATNNWWGTIDEGAIATRVHDFLDDFNLGQVSFTPPLSGPDQQAPAYVRSVTLTPSSPIGIETMAVEVEFSRPMDQAALPTVTFHEAKKGTWQTFSTSNSGIASNDVRGVAFDAEGNAWFGTGDAGASVLRTDGAWQTYNTGNSGLVRDRILDIAFDCAGTAWFAQQSAGVGGTALSGLHADGSWTTHDPSNSPLREYYVRSLAVDQQCRLWVATHGSPYWGSNGLVVLAPDGTWQTYSPANSALPGNDVRDITVAPDGALWFALSQEAYQGDGGVARFDGANWTRYDVDNDPRLAYVTAAVVASDGSAWFGTGQWWDDSRYFAGAGALSYDGTTWRSTRFYWENGGWMIPVSALAYHGDGTIWAAGGGVGVARFTNGRWRPVAGGVAGNAIATDADGGLWFGTNSGAKVLWGGIERPVDRDARWVDATTFRAAYDMSAVIPRGDYHIAVSGAVGSDGIEVASAPDTPLAVDYVGTPDAAAPPAPLVRACGSDSTTTLSAKWTTPAGHDVGLYRYAIGTQPGASDVTNWQATTMATVSRDNLSLLAGQTYYVSVQGRSTGGVWGDVGNSNGVVAAAGGCPVVDFVATPSTGMAPLGVSFAASITGTVTSLLWTYGDAATSSAESPSYTYTTPGIYTVTLDVHGPGGWTTLVKDSYISVAPDTVAPAGSLAINAGAGYATTRAVSLETTASDPSGLSDMRVSNDGSAYSDWATYSSSSAWTLSLGDGPKTVYVQVRDVPGNAATYSDSINLDTSPPSAAVSSLPLFVADPTLDVHWSGSDTDAGLQDYDLQVRVGEGAWTDWLMATTQVAAPYPGASGQTYYFRTRARDTLGNLGTYAVDTGDAHTTVDASAPSGSLVINGGATYASTPQLTLGLSVSDVGPQADVETTARVAVSVDGGPLAPDVAYASSLAYQLSSGDGEREVCARLKDAVGLVSDLYCDRIVLDTVPPDAGLVAAGGAEYATTATVALSVSGNDTVSGLDAMQVSEDGVTWSAWQPYSSTTQWTFGTEGPKTLHLRLRDRAGNQGETSDAIIADWTAPGSQMLPLPETAEGVAWLSWSGADPGGGAVLYDLQVRQGESGDWQPLLSGTTATSTAFTGSAGETYYFRLRASDPAGNAEAWPATPEATTTVGIAPPPGAVLANGGAIATTSRQVTLSFSASGVLDSASELRLSDDGVGWGGWQPYAASIAYTLPPGDGDKTVYAQFRDRAGTISDPVSVTVRLDEAAGTDQLVSVNDGALWTNTVDVTLTLGAPATTTWMQVSNDGGFSGVTWQPFTSRKQWQITSYGSYVIPRTVYYRYRAADGKAASAVSDDIILDVTPPTGDAYLVEGTGQGLSALETPVTLICQARDDVSGVGAMQVSNATDFGEAVWRPFEARSHWTLGPEGVVYIRYRDNAGNVSLTYTAWLGKAANTYVPLIMGDRR